MAPPGVARGTIERFVEESSAWIVAQQAQFASRLRAAPKPYEQWISGNPVEILGSPVLLQTTAHAGSRLRLSHGSRGPVAEIPLHVPDQALMQAKLRALLARWLCAHLHTAASSTVAAVEERFALRPKTIRIKSMQTRWGSCSTRGSINLNRVLIFAPRAVFEYVVYHELSHLRHHNHSPAFWALVSELCPGHLVARSWLKEHGQILMATWV